MALIKSTASFTGTGTSDPVISLRDDFNLSLDFSTGSGVGTVELQRSFDQGNTWFTTDTFTADTENVGDATRENLRWRLNCTAFTSGIIAARISQ